MMARGLLLVAFLLSGVILTGTAGAQDADTVAEEADIVSYPIWERDLAASLRGSQAGHRNWTEGGVNTLAAATQVTGDFVRRSESWRQTYESRLGIGVVRQDTLAVRKAEDVLRLKSEMSYVGNGIFGRFNPTVAAGLRTQFAPGFNYDKNPFGDDRPPPVKVSDFFSPATFTQSVGLAYTSEFTFRQRIGVAAKETVVQIPRLRTLYGQVRSEAVRFQLGVESHTEVDREVFTNVQIKSTLGLFAAFNQEELPDLLWENEIIMSINDWLSTNVEIVALYDRDISNALQLKEVFSIGISIAIL